MTIEVNESSVYFKSDNLVNESSINFGFDNLVNSV